MDLESILTRIQPFLALFVALLAAFLTATWVSAVIWAFRDIRARSRDIFAHILATLLVLIFFPLFPVPGLILYYILRPRETLAEVYERTLEEEALLQGIEERLACPGCNRRINDEFLFCPSCHTRLKKVCVACSRLLHLRWSICPYCGAAQTGSPALVLPPDESDEARQLAGGRQVSLPEPDGQPDYYDEPGPDPELDPLDEPDPELDPLTEPDPEAEPQD